MIVGPGGFLSTGSETVTQGEHQAIEAAVMPPQIEQLIPGKGFLKLASQPHWMAVSFPEYDPPRVAEPFVPI
jgi:hypothetical protein